MLVYTDELPMVQAVARIEKRDPDTARLLVELALFDTLGEMIDENRDDLDAMFSHYVAKRNGEARAALIRTYVERRVMGEPVEDVIKAAGYLRDITDTVIKADDEKPHDVSGEPRDAAGRWTRIGSRRQIVPGHAETRSLDVMRTLTSKPEGTREQAQSIRDELQDGRYAQMRVAGNALIATGNPKAQAAGTLARMAAEVGPSAQDVLGPKLRRVAYRYRGTEKRPDPALRQWASQAAGASELYFGSPEERARVTSALQTVSPGDLAPAAVRANIRGPRAAKSQDQLRLRATTDVATGYLVDQLPTDKEAELSIEAGRTPPSVGVMIDRDGDVVSEAMGYNGDHYLPFDLKNLKRLNGGSYARTRALGGPTSEDIYTGLLSGARQMQVVSRSGVFRIEFDPDLRGGRRYSDKARQMVDRYQRLTDVVDSGQTTEGDQLYEQDLPAEQKRQLRREAAEAADYDENDTKIIYERNLRIARAKASLGFSDEDLESEANDQAQEWARNQIQAGHTVSRGAVGRQREQALRELQDEAREKGRVKRLQLNGEGYFRAMQSLKREFPYFIRDVDYMPLPEFEISRGVRGPDEPLSPRSGAPAKDTHVRRGFIEPKHQADAYERTRAGRAAAAEEPTEDEEGAPTTGARRGAAAPAPGGVPLTEAIKSDAFLRRYGQALNGLRPIGFDAARDAGLRGEIMVGPNVDQMMTREAAFNTGHMEFTAWLFAPGNPETHGRPNDIARFLVEKASPEEVEAVNQAAQEAGEGVFAAHFDQPKLKAAQQFAKLVSMLRQPFAEQTGDPALHMPDTENPKPYPFSSVTRLKDREKDYDDWARHAKAGDLGQAMEWAGDRNPAELARELRGAVEEYKLKAEWGKQIKEARRAGEETPPRVRGLAGSVSAEDAVETVDAGKDGREYKRLAARQEVYAYKHARQMLDLLNAATGEGEADPKARAALESGEPDLAERVHRREGEFGKRRRVVRHGQGSPLVAALAKRMYPEASRRRTRRG